MPSDAADGQGTMAMELEAVLQKHQRMIEVLAGRFRCEWISREELVQAGILGLLRAVSHYDASRDAKLTTYALPWILGEMRRVSKKMQVHTYSLDQEMDTGGQTLYDVLEGKKGIDLSSLDLRLMLSRLNPSEQILICLRYYRDKTQKETAILLGKSQTQISRMERQALDKLHAWLS